VNVVDTIDRGRGAAIEEPDGVARAIARDPGSGEDPAGFVVELAHFSGPLDLLLTLLREEQIDIYDIPIARIAEQFLARIQTLRLDEAAEYLEMAARLLRIKAQMLLPQHGTEEPWDDPRAELVRRLLEYQQVREVVDVLDSRAELRRNRFAHPCAPQPEQPAVPGRLSTTLAELFAAVDRVLRLARGPTVHSVVPRALDVVGAVSAARALLARRASLRWSDLVPSGAEAWQVLSVLLALLELARLGECVLRQPMPFAPVEIGAAQRSAALPATREAPEVADHAPSTATADADAPNILAPQFEPAHDTASAAA
jgi:segregation and condensation protein A